MRRLIGWCLDRLQGRSEAYKFYEMVLDEFVEDGILKVAGCNWKGEKIYVVTEASKGPHLIRNPPRTMQ
jgi:hypothetical protein